jgi:hypothetical protein
MLIKTYLFSSKVKADEVNIKIYFQFWFLEKIMKHYLLQGCSNELSTIFFVCGGQCSYYLGNNISTVF